MIRLLVANGARPDVTDTGGFTPADAALARVAGPMRANIAPDVQEDGAKLLQELTRS